jgi:hypothetical protein
MAPMKTLGGCPPGVGIIRAPITDVTKIRFLDVFLFAGGDPRDWNLMRATVVGAMTMNESKTIRH